MTIASQVVEHTNKYRFLRSCLVPIPTSACLHQFMDEEADFDTVFNE